jgi:RND family efflux transporter MFP subunit
MKPILPAIAIVAVAFATFSILRNKPRHAATEPPAPPPMAAFAETVAAVGMIEASSENIAIGSHLAGVVEKVFVQAGQAVEEGAPLFALDTRQLAAELAVRRAALVTAQAQAKTAQTQLADAADQLARSQQLGKERVISTDEWNRRKFAVQTAEARLGEAQAAVVSAEALIGENETNLERSIVRAPLAGTVLQVKVRPGEFAPAGQTAEPLLTLGCLRPLHVRVDVDEHEGWRVRTGAPAVAHVRGNASFKTPLKFVRFEPLVVPKRSLTGNSTERVDTRVLQVIYAVPDDTLPLFVGQQMDVFIEESAAPAKTAAR